MSATELVRGVHSRMKRYGWECVEGFARRLYQAQMEVYSTYPGHNYFRARRFEELNQKTRDAWVEAAARHVPE